MALKSAKETYAMFSHVEDGRAMNRRIHRIEIQARDGQMHVIEGKNLPTHIQTRCGAGHKGDHVLEILMRPKSRFEAAVSWPTNRDLAHAVLGVLFVVLARLVASIVRYGL